MHAAVDDLYRAHGARALRLAYLLTGDRSAAEEIVQEAFVRLLGRLREIRDPNALQGYLDRSVANLAKNHYRGNARQRLHLSTQAAQTSESLPDFAQRDELHRELLGLPYRQRAALVLRYCEDLPESEVAEALGTSSKAVRSLVGRGLATLRDARERV